MPEKMLFSNNKRKSTPDRCPVVLVPESQKLANNNFTAWTPTSTNSIGRRIFLY